MLSVRRCRRSLLLVTLLLLVAPAVGFSCELASALCGPEAASAAGVKAPPCHGMPDMAMDCCSIQAPAEQPPAASVAGVELQVGALNLVLGASLSPSPAVATRPSPSTLLEHAPDQGRYALFSSYLL